jgi:phosphohistidine phosphatase
MKTVLIFRHAKSDWSSSESFQDHERPLAPRGRNAAKLMGRFVSEVEEVPDTVITSSAVRAVRTVEIAAKAGRWGCPINAIDALYACSPQEILAEIRSQNDSVERLLVSAHEPACSETIALFAAGCRLRFPTAAMARLDLPVGAWVEVAFGQAELIWLVIPAVAEKLL